MHKQTPGFSFIKDDVLRQNLNITFAHILRLMASSNTKDFDELIRSSFRKSIIIHTASIIEALLMYLLRKQKTEEELSANFFQFKIKKVLYEINKIDKIVIGREIPKPIKFEKLSLDQINTLCRDHQIIPKELFDQINKVRLLRNQLHISTLKKVDSDYTDKELDFVFSIAREMKNLVKNHVK